MKLVKPRWLFKSKVDRLTVWVGRLGRRAIVARTRSPKFCFEGRNEADVRAAAERAIRFYRKAVAANVHGPSTNAASIEKGHD